MTTTKHSTTTVSITADKAYKLALKALAEERGVFMGDLVREAVDAKFGTELKPLVLFFASRLHLNDISGNQVKRKTNRKDTPK